MKKKFLIVVMAMCLLAAVCIGGTLAWLTDKTEPITNTFTFGMVEITLTENTGSTYTIVPGDTIDKDPTVAVDDESEDCYVYVKVEVANNSMNLDGNDGDETIINWAIAAGWTELDDVDNVWYRLVDDEAAVKEFSVLANDEVTVSNMVTAAHTDTINRAKPTITITAYAVQASAGGDAAEAWTAAAFA